LRLGDFKSESFPGFGELDYLEIDDLDFLRAMVSNTIEDTLLVTYVGARYRREEYVAGSGVLEALQLIETGGETRLEPFVHPDYGAYLFREAPSEAVVNRTAPSEAVVNPNMLQESLARMPIELDEQAVDSLARFVNTYLVTMLYRAGENARQEGADVIATRHFLPSCELWPYPLNKFC
jgi:hypothetical protein